uniref:Uncharacterized protein n=1 Tax=Rhizophagus irregularis (strain DAOM 181602 / DAOM 197198 / MUCL 43194) TaxID=747089 RepID=U9UHN3_RHIID
MIIVKWKILVHLVHNCRGECGPFLTYGLSLKFVHLKIHDSLNNLVIISKFMRD